MKLNDIIHHFDELVESYSSDPLKGSGDIGERDALHDYLDRFTDLYRHMREPAKETYGWRTQHDDKAATAMKARIAKRIMKDEEVSWSRSYEMAPADIEYEEFLNGRVFYYESWDSMNHLRDTIKQYIINIGQRLAHL